MDILQKITQHLDSRFLLKKIKRVGLFRRSLMVELFSGEYGLSTYDHHGKTFDCKGLTIATLLDRSDYGDHYFRAVLLASINAHYNQKEKLLNVSYKKAHHFLYAQNSISSIASIGRFPFIQRLAVDNNEIIIFELEPREGELGVDDYDKLSHFKIVFITAMTLMNGTFDDIFFHCHKDSTTIMIGPTTPFHKTLLESGLSTVAGVEISSPLSLWHCLDQGKSFKHAQGMNYWSYDA